MCIPLEFADISNSPDSRYSCSLLTLSLENELPPKKKSEKPEEKAKKKVARVKKTVGKVIHKSRSLALQKPVLVIVLGRPLAGPVHNTLATIADGEFPNIGESLGTTSSGVTSATPAVPTPVPA